MPPFSSVMHTHTLGVSLVAARDRERKDKEETARPGKGGNYTACFSASSHTSGAVIREQQTTMGLFQIAQGPEAKKMTETCYVASSAWGCGAEWLVSIYKWGF